jgi:copper resistance protein C
MDMRNTTIIAFCLALLCGPGAAEAHAFLDHANPAVGSTVAGSPGAVTLYFTESLEPRFSGGEVHNATGARVDHGASVSGKVMRLSVGALPAGSYSVSWHALSVDTHKTQGSFSFSVGK